MTTDRTTAADRAAAPDLERLDREIISLLARRREMAKELPPPSRARAVDPEFTRTVQEMTDRYRKELGGAGELVARAVMVLCHPGRTA